MIAVGIFSGHPVLGVRKSVGNVVIRYVEQRVCDYCDTPVWRTYTVSRDGATAPLDLCEEHAAPVEAALTAHAPDDPLARARALNPKKKAPPRREAPVNKG